MVPQALQKILSPVCVALGLLCTSGCQQDVEQLAELCLEIHAKAEAAGDCAALMQAVQAPMATSRELQRSLEKDFSRRRGEVTDEDREAYEAYQDAVRPCRAVQLELARRCGLESAGSGGAQ